MSRIIRRFSIATLALLFSVVIFPNTAFATQQERPNIDKNAVSISERLDRSTDPSTEWVKFSASERLDRSTDPSTEWVKFSASESIKGANLSLSNIFSHIFAKTLSLIFSILS